MTVAEAIEKLERGETVNTYPLLLMLKRLQEVEALHWGVRYQQRVLAAFCVRERAEYFRWQGEKGTPGGKGQIEVVDLRLGAGDKAVPGGDG